MNGVVFWGGTGQARVVRELLAGSPPLVAVVDADPALEPPFADVPLFHSEDELRDFIAGRGPLGCLATIGGQRGAVRLQVQRVMAALGLTPLVAVHRTAFVASDATVGPGSQILAQSAVCAGAVLGEACIVNTAASVDHECTLGDGVHIGPGAHLAGLVAVEPYVFVGTGAAVLPRLRLGQGCVVGAGSVVTRDVPPGVVVAGSPAREIGRRTP